MAQSVSTYKFKRLIQCLKNKLNNKRETLLGEK